MKKNSRQNDKRKLFDNGIIEPFKKISSTLPAYNRICIIVLSAILLSFNTISASAQKLLWAHTQGSFLEPGDKLNAYAVSQGWTSTAAIIGNTPSTSVPTTVGPITGQVMGGQTLTKANFDAVIFGTIYNYIDPTCITALINFMNEGGIVYFMCDGVFNTQILYSSQENQLLSAAIGYNANLAADVIDNTDRSNITQVPYRNINGIQTSAAGCGSSVTNLFRTGNYIPASSIPNNILYYTYNSSPWVNLLFARTVAGGVLGISTEFYSGGSGDNNTAALAEIYKNLFTGQLTLNGTCQLPSAKLTKSVSPTSIIDGGTAVYTFSITNTAVGGVNQSNISFTDNLPAGLKLTATPNAVLNGGSGGTIVAVSNGNSVSLSGFSLNAGQTATLTVNVTNVPGQLNTSCGANPANFTNKSTNITPISTNLANEVGNVCLIVNAQPCAASAGTLQ